MLRDWKLPESVKKKGFNVKRRYNAVQTPSPCRSAVVRCSSVVGCYPPFVRDYSARIAVSGSTPAARRAGMNAAAKPAAPSTITTAANVSVSVGATP